MNQSELFEKYSSLLKEKKKLRDDLLSMKDNLEILMADTPLFIGFAKKQIDKALQTLDS